MKLAGVFKDFPDINNAIDLNDKEADSIEII